MKTTKPTPGEVARRQAGYSLEQAARKLGLSKTRGPRYLRSFELHGGAPWHICERLGRLYGCSGDVFFHGPAYWAKLDQLKAREAALGAPAGGVAGSYPTPCANERSLAAAAGADTGARGETCRNETRASRRYSPPRTPLLTVIE